MSQFCTRKGQDALIAEHLTQLLVAYLGQGWKHHHNQADGYRNIRCSNLKTIDERSGAGNKVPDAYAHRHGEEYPER
jgi:hypothetical protein